MSKNVYVDQEICISCGLCVETAPEVFRMNDDNLAEVYDPAGARRRRSRRRSMRVP